MLDNEGSLSNEDSDIDEAEETQVQSEESTDEKPEGKTSETEGQTSESTLKDQEEKDKPELTEKGTKLADDPLSRVNQELANERAKIRQYEDVLNNPTLLKGYVAQFDKPDTKQEEVKEPEIRVEDIQTVEDLQKYQRQQDRKVDAKLKELDSTISEVKSNSQKDKVGSRLHNDITTIKETWNELDAKRDKDGKATNPNYNEQLDQAISAIYDMYDKDPKTGDYKGQVSIKDIADRIMPAVEASKQRGSTEAQTDIRDKRTGKAVSGASNTAPDESSMTSSQLIAHRIKQARGGR